MSFLRALRTLFGKTQPTVKVPTARKQFYDQIYKSKH